MKIVIVIAALTAVAAMGVACADYQPPPKGEQGYCYRIVFSTMSESLDNFTFYTDVEPLWEGQNLIVQETWWALDRDGARLSDLFDDPRYDRYSEAVYLSRDIASVLNVQQRCEGETP